MSSQRDSMPSAKNIRSLENYLDTLMDTIPGSVYCKDLNGVYLDCNIEVARKSGLGSKEKIIGKNDYDLWPEIADKIRENDLEVIQSNQTREFEEKIILPTGEVFYFTSVKTPLRNGNGDIIGIVGNSLDITELKMAKDQADSANQAKSQFLAMVSHELRIPLTGIISTASMLAEGKVTFEESRTFGKIMLESGNYLMSHINNILEFSRLESGKYELHEIPMDLKIHVEETVQTLTPAAKNKGLEIFVIYDPEVPFKIKGDPRVLRQILNNLLSNAIKFTERGHIILKVTCVKQTAQSAQIEIAVQDTGIGIPEDKFDAIFEKFFQIEDAYVRKHSQNGTGLGLSIVKKLAALMNGEIHLVSELGKGSTFSLIAEFPLQDEYAISSSGIKVLMVEDNLIAQRVHKMMLDKLGCEVDIADNGQAAINFVTDNREYNIIFVDIGLPDISGYEVIRQIRQFHAKYNTRIPIIALTAFTRDEERLACLKAGADEVAAKPIYCSTLEEIFNRYQITNYINSNI